MVEVESKGSIVGYISLATIPLDNTIVTSKCANVVAGAKLVKSSTGT